MSKVILQECKEYNIDLLTEKINAGIEMLGGWNSFVSPGMTVLLVRGKLPRAGHR
ncbi:MAG: hypothetical protein WCX60_07220 [Anaerovoracaceae bacterium]